MGRPTPSTGSSGWRGEPKVIRCGLVAARVPGLGFASLAGVMRKRRLVTRWESGVTRESERERGRRERMRERQEAMRARMERLSERAQEERGRRGWVDAIFEVVDRDVEVAGGIMAGALAYRLFIWLLPFGLVFVGGLGVIAGVSSDSPKGVASKLGVGGIISSSLHSASKSHSAWYALIIGIPILLLATRSVLRVLIGTHRLAWGDVRAAAPKPTMTDAAKLLGVFVLYFALALLAAWARARSPAAGLVVTIVVIAGFTGVWLWTSIRLPHRDAGWVDSCRERSPSGSVSASCRWSPRTCSGRMRLRSREPTGRLASPRRSCSACGCLGAC